LFLSIENVKHESEKEEPSTSVLQPLSESATSTSAQPVLLIVVTHLIRKVGIPKRFGHTLFCP
jgi:hypothetical protein